MSHQRKSAGLKRRAHNPHQQDTPDHNSNDDIDDDDRVSVLLFRTIGQHPLLDPEEELRLGTIIQQWVKLEHAETKYQAARAKAIAKAKKDKAKAKAKKTKAKAKKSKKKTKTKIKEQRARRSHLRALKQARLAGASAHKQLVECNLRLVLSIAKDYQGHHSLDLLDLFQEGTLGAGIAAFRFDPKRGYKYSTYASWWIRSTIRRAVHDTGRTIRLPVYLQECIGKVLRATEDLRGLGEEATDQSVAALSGVPVNKVALVKQTPRALAQLDQPVGGDDESPTLLEVTEDDSRPSVLVALIQTAEVEALRAALLGLDERLRVILALRFYGLLGDGEAGVPSLNQLSEKLRLSREDRAKIEKNGCTLAQIGAFYGYSRERIRQLQKQALKQLRRSLRKALQEKE